MTIQQFITENNIKRADAILLRKKFLGMVDHYVLFIGYRYNNPVFTANYKDGIREVSYQEIQRYLQFLNPVSIVRFPGTTENERVFAIQRALMRIGERAYDIIRNNCESYKNWVHYGENISSQAIKASKISTGLGIATAIAALATGNKKLGATAATLVLTGAIINNKLNE